MKNFNLVATLHLMIVYVVWGSTFYGVKLALEGGLTPFYLIGFRFLIAGSVLYLLSRFGGLRAATPTEWKEAGLLSFLLLVCGAGLVAWSQRFISSSLAALLVASSPVWVTLLDPEQKLTLRKWVGLLLGLGGVGSLVGASLSFDREGFLWGCLGCLASGVAWAFGSLRARRTTREIPPMAGAGMQMICAGLALLVLALSSGRPLVLEAISVQAWAAWLYLTFIGSLLAYSSYTWLVGNTSAALASTHAYINPVVAVLLGSLLGGESLSLTTTLAAAVALSGVIILMLPEPSSRPAPVPEDYVPGGILRYSKAARRARRQFRRAS